ncbi:MAG: recombinase family protein [Anaerolineaceae bacterium]
MNTQIKNPQLAAIYIRVSSEHQAEKSSPEEQELDCLRMAKENNLSVVEIYRDTQKYRTGNRLVEPSGTRLDRPELQRLLHDAQKGVFDTIIAWREDRLYRGLKSMIMVLDIIQENKLNVLLAKEHFDQRMAPVKAWVGQMELDGMRERMSMGVKARLKAGKANTGQDRYGYQRKGEVIDIVEEEAIWVKQIFEWYLQKVPLHEIRRRLIERDAPQKGSSTPRKIHWAITSIQSILKAAKEYSSGIKTFSRDGDIFEISVPIILDMDTYNKFIILRQINKTLPVHHTRVDYLCVGLVTCACGKKWRGVTYYRETRKNRRGEVVPRKTIEMGNYYCSEKYPEMRHPDCPKSIGHKLLDDYVWNRLISVLQDPNVLLGGAQRFVNNINKKIEASEIDTEKLHQELDSLTMERQWVITQARKNRISDEDMEYQLSAINIQELDIKKKINNQNELEQVDRLKNWESITIDYLKELSAGLEWLKIAPLNEEERIQKFQLKQRLVRVLVEKIVIGKDRKIEITIAMDLLGIIAAQSTAVQIQSVGTYTHKPTCRVRRRPGAACG